MVRRNCDRSFNAKLMEEFDETEVIRASELQENEDQAALKFLRGGYSRLVHTTSEQSAKLGSVEAKLGSVEAKLLKVKNTLSQLATQLGIHPIDAESSQQVPPVTYVSDPYVRNDVNRLPLDNRKSLSHKIEMPEFDGSNASDWLSKVERFFSVRRYSDLDKLDLVAFSLEGDMLLWFDREMTRCEFHSWDEFRRRLLLKFGAAPEKSSENVAEILEERASYSEKKGTVSASVIESAELSFHVIGLDESHLEQLFSNGLQTEMQEVLKLPEPMGLENHKPAGTFISTPVASVNSISFAVGTDETIFSGLSQTSQVWEPGGVLVEHVLVDFIVAAQLAEKYAEESEESLDGTEDVVPVVARGPEISPTLSEACTQVLLEPRMQVTEALVNARLAKKPIILTNWVKLIAEKSICSEIPGYYRPSVRVGEALLDVVTTPVIDDAIFQFVLDRTVSHEWHRWKHKTATVTSNDRVNAADIGRQAVLEQITKGVRHAWLHNQWFALVADNIHTLPSNPATSSSMLPLYVYQMGGSDVQDSDKEMVADPVSPQLILDDLKSHLRHKWKSKHLQAVVNLQNSLSYALDVVTQPVPECKPTAAIFQLVLEQSVSHDCFLDSLWEKENVSWLGVVCVLAACMMHKATWISAKLPAHGLLVFPWNLLLLEFVLFIHLEDKVCLSGASSRWCGWLVFDRGKKKIISGDVQNRLQNLKLTDTKLAAEYFGPFQVVERIGVVVFKDQPLPKIAAMLDSFAPVFVIVILVVVDRLSKTVQVLGLKHPFKPGWVVGVINKES